MVFKVCSGKPCGSLEDCLFLSEKVNNGKEVSLKGSLSKAQQIFFGSGNQLKNLDPHELSGC